MSFFTFRFFWNFEINFVFFCLDRVSLAQTGSLSIFSSREQEYEQRALLLRRLAFVIFCSELDQYHKYMPEIQGKKIFVLFLIPDFLLFFFF